MRLAESERRRIEDELDTERSLAGFVDDELVATLSAYRCELCVPGARLVSATALTDIGVVPTERGRGHFRRLLECVLSECHRRDEPIAILNADQAALYPRFGFGIATVSVSSLVALPPGAVAPEPEPDRAPVELRMLSPEEAAVVAPALWSAGAARRVGEVTRTESWWVGHFAEEARSVEPVQHLALVRSGTIDGYCTWTRHSLGDGSYELVVRELDALDDPAERALLRFFLGRRDATRLRFVERPPDDPMAEMLSDVRVRAIESVRDQMWLRLIDVESALGLRAFPPGRLGIAVEDPLCPWNAATYAIDSDGADVTVRRVEEAPAISVGVDALGALFLGGTSPRALWRAGRLAAAGPDALAEAQRLFAAERAPFCQTVL